MNHETIAQLIQNAAPLLASLLSKPPPPPHDAIRMKGDRFITFLTSCPSDVRLMANAIDPDAIYVFRADTLRELANVYTPADGH